MAGGDTLVKALALWMWILLLQGAGTEAGENCQSYDHYRGTKRELRCEHDCCHEHGDVYCCEEDTYAGAIVGGIVSMVFVAGMVLVIICCCVSACPLYKSRGATLGWGRPSAMGTRPQDRRVVVSTTNTTMQPVQYGFQTQPVGQPPVAPPYYEQKTYPGVPAYPPPEYQQTPPQPNPRSPASTVPPSESAPPYTPPEGAPTPGEYVYTAPSGYLYPTPSPGGTTAPSETPASGPDNVYTEII